MSSTSCLRVDSSLLNVRASSATAAASAARASFGCSVFARLTASIALLLAAEKLMGAPSLGGVLVAQPLSGEEGGPPSDALTLVDRRERDESIDFPDRRRAGGEFKEVA